VQVWTPLSAEHWVALGVHEPEHEPFTQAWFAQGDALPQVPSAPQVWTPLSTEH
jgi:hypothetical protein